MTRRDQIIEDLMALCRKHGIELEADTESTVTTVWDYPVREADLDRHDQPREYPIFRFTRVAPNSIEIE